MHGYSTDSSERRVVPLLLALLSITLAWVSSKFLAAARLSVPWWLDAPSSMAFYGALYGLFERFLWRNGFVRKLGDYYAGRDRRTFGRICCKKDVRGGNPT